MKKFFNILTITGLCVCAALLAGACNSPLTAPVKGKSSSPAGMGTVLLSVAGSGARTLLPDGMDELIYTAECIDDAGNESAESHLLSGGSGAIQLKAGVDWTITINAKTPETSPDADDGVLVGTAEVKVTLVAGEPKTVPPVYLQPVFESGDEGILEWSVDFPDTFDYVRAKLIYDDDEFILTDDNSGTKILAPGSYLFRAILELADGRKAGKTESVHIYKDMTTVLEWDFTSKDFATPDSTEQTEVLFAWDRVSDYLEGTSFTADTVRQVKDSDKYMGVRQTAIAIDDGAIKLGGSTGSNAGRLIIGSGSGTTTADPVGGVTAAAPSPHLPGQFDLSKGTFRLTIDYHTPVYGGASGTILLRVGINCNTTGTGSVLGSTSNMRSYTTIEQLTDGRGVIDDVDDKAEYDSVTGVGRITLYFTPSERYISNAGKDSLEDAFVMLYSQLNNFITLTSIKLEKLKDVIRYSDYGAVGDGVTDDFDAIIAAHADANILGANVRADVGATYYIGGAQKTAKIQTNTDWTGASFIIDDTGVSRTGNTWNDSWVFEIVSAQESIPLTTVVSTLAKNQTKLSLALASPAVLVAIDSTTKRYIRRGTNENSGTNQTDVFIVDKNGNVDSSSPIIWDFTNISSLIAYPIDEDVLTVTGGAFTTNANRGNETAQTGVYLKRGIRIERSNTVIDGLVHLVTGDESDLAAEYTGFIRIESCANVTIKNSTLTGRRAYEGRSSYDINANRIINLSVIDCGQTNSITDTDYWGVFTSNFSKNILFNNVKFSRFDAHQGVRNVTIKNSELGHQRVSLIGSGRLEIENTKVSARDFFFFRNDYGSSWEGEVYIKNCTFAPIDLNSARIIYANNDGQWDFGYDCFMPHTITIEGLTIEDDPPPYGYEGAFLVYAVNDGSSELYPFTLTQTINLSGFQSSMPYRMSNAFISSQITVIE